jgi:protein-tyrosine kinase
MVISERISAPTVAPATARNGGVLVIDPTCPAAVREAYSQTFLSVRFALLGRPGGSVLVSAVDSTAAAAPLAANLAILAAQEGERVVLIDADPHSPTLDNLFTLSTRPGFSSLIRHDGADVAAAVQETDVPKLWLVGAGDEGGYPGGIGRAPALAEVVRRLKAGVERLILIGAPILSHVDSMDLCPHVDGVVLAVAPGKTHRLDAARAREVLDRVHAPLLGVVLTGKAL